jgi:hypothetical protein
MKVTVIPMQRKGYMRVQISNLFRSGNIFQCVPCDLLLIDREADSVRCSESNQTALIYTYNLVPVYIMITSENIRTRLHW